ncbi:polysaccharide deacetylase family protein [Roseomonas sp. BN140053]|uniref:polysaccharide deacetylase family protein n=1 Tax=Roseomonas sp. BN140053 TaxID=3391898 RepID=UPI0039E7FEE5
MTHALFPNIRPALPRSDDPILAVAVDAEEDFDWDAPVRGTPHTTGHMRNIRDLQAILGAYGLRPTYLLTYPVLEDTEVVRILERHLRRGECDVGVQLHPWVTPPFTGDGGTSASYSGNLPPELEAQKLATLIRRFTERFGVGPRIYRAGRYGLSAHTAGTLEELGFEIDTSVAPRTDFSPDGGPDYSGYDYRPFWFGRRRTLLELPLCRSIVGWGGRRAPWIYQALADASPPFRLGLSAALTRMRCAERITLSPEGNDRRAMIRLVRRLTEGGHRVFVLSFHSSSLAVGRSPYVQSRAELHHFYDRLSAILDFMARQPRMRFASLAEIPSLLEAPAA